METSDKRIQIYYTKGQASRDYMATDMMESMNQEPDIDKEYGFPSEADLEEDYGQVADFEFDALGYKSADHLLEHLFKQFNHVDYEGITANLADQDFIRENKLHTSISVGDVVQIDDTFYYVDGIGFKQFNPKDQ
mgnify:CR=1 FL=1